MDRPEGFEDVAPLAELSHHSRSPARTASSAPQPRTLIVMSLARSTARASPQTR
jgi:hypothetical protein